MRIAVTYDNGNIYTHYSRTPRIKIYQTFDNRITDTQLVPVHGFMRSSETDNLLRDYNVDVLICNRIGIGARAVIMASGIKIVDNQRGNADMAVARYLGIPFNPPAPKPVHRPVTAPRQSRPVTPPPAKPAPQPKPPVSAGRKMEPAKPAPSGRGMQPSKPAAPGGRKEAGRNAPSGRGTMGNSRGGGFRK